MNTLAQTPAGTTVKVTQLNSHPETCNRLRELGFCENTLIRCVTNGSTQLICEVCNTRVGMNRSIAQTIFVMPVEN